MHSMNHLNYNEYLLCVFVANESVMEDPHAFMCPQQDYVFLIRETYGLCHEESLEDLTHVPQVEGVVRLIRSGQQLLRYSKLNRITYCKE